MSSSLWIERESAVPTPAELAAYLRHHAWTRSHSDEAWAFFETALGSSAVRIEVPQKASARDYPRAVRTLLDDLSRLEGRAPAAILRDIIASSTDIVRIGIHGAATRDGSISVEAGVRAFDATRAIVLGAACSAIEPRAAYSKRKPDRAMDVLRTARFGQPEMGSYILTVEVAVAPLLRPTLPLGPDIDPDPDAPIERRTTLRLASGLEGAMYACRESVETQSIEPFNGRITSGVSANLCDALADILDATNAERIDTSVSFAPVRPVASGARREARFIGPDRALLREAAQQLRAESTYADIEVIGTIVNLESSNAAVGGSVVIQALVDDRVRRITAGLESMDYGVAIDAHRDRAIVRVVGELARDGRSWVLRSPRDLARAPVEE